MSNIFTNPHLTSVTPELRDWIITQAKAGVSAPRALQAMLDAGWQEEVAMAALESALLDHLQGGLAHAQTGSTGGNAQAAAVAVAAQPGADGQGQGASPMPDLALDGAPAELDAGDRRVRVIMNLQKPRVVVLDGLLDATECAELVSLAKPHMKRSLTVDSRSASGGDELNADRTSEGMFFERGQHPVVAALEARIAHLLGWPVENGEGLQVLRYGPGAEYKPHYDYFEPGLPSTPTLLRRGGQRLATMLVYLNTPAQGGGTIFPNAALEVCAQQGMAVFFSYDRPDPGTLSLHGGSPVISGEKWVATKWLRERQFQ
ncbi:2-oxoglutarate-dependent dioxygenase [Corticibacter populi]|uniref:2-oxoglutarate-dependent dioxygenase n=1 Tax=Corticibacter populi TaxID=1550736 RepID=A0A3M6QXW8_9BURK|nr:2OG-Fe(II) oxygenase [Corticibacter populi]RMX07761.1 2-oxoglutarate-dependent dioxygenase [Corticibacter populi]RZS34983.1 prolyl 4-hydroxylase [Corticibacter populi]